MRFTDLIASALGSLRQRPFRTLMTVLGVIIGTTAVVVMVSFGVGMTQSYLDSLEQNTSLREVQVYMAPPDALERGLPAELNDTFVTHLAEYPGVRNAWPIYTLDAVGRVDTQESWMQITAVPAGMLEGLNLPLAWGDVPTVGEPGVVMGDMMADSFYDPLSGTMNGVDFRTQTMFVEFQNQMEMPPPGGEGETPTPARRIILPVVGEVAGAEDQAWGPNSSVVYAEFGAMVDMLEKAMPGKALPNQPATPDGKPKPGFVYSMIRLQTDSPEDAEALLMTLRDEGIDAQADIEWIRQAQQQAVAIQAVFGGIGFISLLVAAIGIANTMMMSVYERTREIGVMKVMGAGLGDIRKLFLFESATIGLLGGLLGILLSLGASSVANAIFTGMAGEFGAGRISIIPPWLMLGALAFATLIGTVAGLAPALRASRLSPLAAIRTQ